jgi:hypothetical protein
MTPFFQRWFPGLYKAYSALSPKHRRRREARTLLEARRWAAKRKIGQWVADQIDQAIFDALSGNR